ncbi:hypothetical protein [Macrococcus carouselicus]|uniref:Uncharacterized protein n=1 Tax=Macrococcus carouselicus TaxID=69969 RepID=A0A9Q8FPF1_9STAP|nr:hypothetical protein [Macrococcus carouselicus]TDL94265.1 hypothetical protein ERX40_11045 [Macrococcus carouselicus]
MKHSKQFLIIQFFQLMAYAIIFNIMVFNDIKHTNVIFLILPFLFTYIFENIAVFVDETELKIIKMINSVYLIILISTYLLRYIGVSNIVNWIDENKFYLLFEMIVGLIIVLINTRYKKRD